MFRNCAIFVLSIVACAPVLGQTTIPQPARDLGRFETLWLTAHLNGDRNWLSRFSAGKVEVVPPSVSSLIEDRAEAIAAATATKLQANEVKVRISGTISLLTNVPDKNRSFHFLDTFNQVGGKWRVIASSISPISETSGPEEIALELLRFEDDRARALINDDSTALYRLLSPNFVGTMANGTVQDGQEWVHARELQGFRSAVNSDMRVHILSGELAVVTGIETVGGPRPHKNTTRYRFTSTWAKSKGEWQCVASHSSPVA